MMVTSIPGFIASAIFQPSVSPLPMSRLKGKGDKDSCPPGFDLMGGQTCR